MVICPYITTMKRFLLLLTLLLLLPSVTHGQNENHAGLIMQFSDGTIETYCIAFEEESISGLELVQRAGLDVIVQPSGNNAAVCKIEEDGCDFPAESCFCRFGGGQRGEYWSFWQLQEDAWSYSPLGAGVVQVRDGDVNGWAWGAGSEGRAAPPPAYTFDQICSAGSPATPSAESPLVVTNTPMIDQLPTVDEQPAPSQSAIPTSTSLAENSRSQNVVGYAVFGVLAILSLSLIGVALRRSAR